MKNLLISLLLIASLFSFSPKDIEVGQSFLTVKSNLNNIGITLEQVDSNMYFFETESTGDARVYLLEYKGKIVKRSVRTGLMGREESGMLFYKAYDSLASEFGSPFRVEGYKIYWCDSTGNDCSALDMIQVEEMFSVYIEYYDYKGFMEYYNWKNGRKLASD